MTETLDCSRPVLVAGGGGYIGGWLVRDLLGGRTYQWIEGEVVEAMNRTRPPHEGEKASLAALPSNPPWI